MMTQPPVFNQPLQQKEELKQSEQEKQKTEQPIQQVSNNMVEVLKNSTNAKHRNCEFLKFLN